MDFDLDREVSRAISCFWKVRARQDRFQGTDSGTRDAGNRAAVTAGKQLEGFTELIQRLLLDAGLPEVSVHTRSTALPGYYRPTKSWDVVAMCDTDLVAAIEFKSHVGPSFGNNYNNRVEEALGSSVDLLDAYKHGVYAPSSKPWIRWLMVLEDTGKSNAPVKAKSEHFPTIADFSNASYAQRYEIFCKHLLRDQRYDGACLLLSEKTRGSEGAYSEPSVETGFRAFAASLHAHASSKVLLSRI